MTIAVIPARGGSKRIPRKNIRMFAGQPVIAWSIQAAQDSACFEHIIVSTDDDEIADVARTYGAEVPFRRPNELSDDHATTGAVMAHALESIGAKMYESDLACCIYATAPFLFPPDLRRGQALLAQHTESDYAFSVTSYAFAIQRALRLDANGVVSMFYPEHVLTRSQDLEPAYHDAGQFYWGRVQAWRTQKPILTSSALSVYLPRHRVQDIDTEEDWLRAEAMFMNRERE